MNVHLSSHIAARKQGLNIMGNSMKSAAFLIESRLAEAARGSNNAYFDLGVIYSTGSSGIDVDLIEAHDTTTPFFLYLAFHNEHDPHQAPLESVQSFPHIVDDTYKVTAAMIETMDVQIGRVVAALNSTGMVSLPRPAHAHA